MNNAQKKLAWFGALALAGILIISFVPTTFHIGSYDFRKVDFVADVKKDSATSTGGKTVKGKNSHSTNTPVKVDSTRDDYFTYKDIINYSRSSKQPVGKFVQALRDYKAGKRNKIRIAYLGDSFIEGDLITMDLREMMQSYFGGSGAGFVPITSITAGFRQTITHSFSRDWTDFSFKSSGDRSNVFISGHNYNSNGSWVEYTAPNRPHLNFFQKVYMLYKSNEPFTATINGGTTELPAAPNMSSALVAQNVQKLTASIASPDPTLYGFSFEADTGILVDNFSFRGISGMEMQYINPAVLSQINSVHPYDLIIFQYGPNLLFKPNLDNFDFYLKPMVKAVSQFRDAFPQADILMLSTGDKAFRYGGQYATAKGVLPLLQVQQQVAAEAGINFWNFFLNMGGEGSMIKWVEGDTAFANRDYTHVNFRGGKKIAGLLFNTLMNAYKSDK